MIRVQNSFQLSGELLRKRFVGAGLLEAVQDAVVVFDMSGKCVFWNETVASEIGYAEEEICNIKVCDLVPAADHRKSLELQKTLLSRGHAFSSIRCITKDKREIPLEVSGTLVRDAKGNRLGRCWICRKRRGETNTVEKESGSETRSPSAGDRQGRRIDGAPTGGPEYPMRQLIGKSESFSEVKRLVSIAATVDAPVLITGETGTGKSVVARAIHELQRRAREGQFISQNSAALPESLIEAELFGSEKGAFTGATARRRGLFELAEDGTLFLDEIGDMPFHLQAKLLSALEDKRIRRIGGDCMTPINARLIAATSVPVKELLEKRMRRDLYYRLCVIHIHIAPLRERREDVVHLSHYLVDQLRRDREAFIDEAEIQRLMNYDWPGNVRELRNAIERALILQAEPRLRPSRLLSPGEEWVFDAAREDPGEQIELLTIKELERNHIENALAKCSYNHTKTAMTLGISLSTLKRKLKSYAMS